MACVAAGRFPAHSGAETVSAGVQEHRRNLFGISVYLLVFSGSYNCGFLYDSEEERSEAGCSGLYDIFHVYAQLRKTAELQQYRAYGSLAVGSADADTDAVCQDKICDTGCFAGGGGTVQSLYGTALFSLYNNLYDRKFFRTYSWKEHPSRRGRSRPVSGACRQGDIQEREELFGLKAWMFVTVGAGILLAIFLVFLLSRTTVAEITENFVYIFWDPAHEKKTISNFFESIIWFIDWFKWFFLVFGAGVLGAVFCPKLRKLMYIGLMLLSVLLWVLLVVFKSPGVGKHMIMLPLTMLGGTAFALTREKAWDIFIKGWMVGIVYAVCMNLSSNQGVYVMCNACTISSCVSLFLIRDFFEEHPEWRSRSWWLAALAAAQLLSEAGVNLRAVYGEDNISALTCQIEQGPQKGIWTTEEKKEDYNINYENIKSIGNLAGKTIMFFNYFPCGYLAANEAENGAFSAWVPEYKRLDSGRLPVYYEFHPDKVPDVIYIDTLAVLEWPEDEWDDWCRQNHYLREDFPRGGSVMLLQE